MTQWVSNILASVARFWKSPMVTVSFPLGSGYVNPSGGGLVMMPSDTLTLDRLVFTDLSTIGNFLIDGDIFCKSLELSCRKANALGKMAIPAGKYELQINAVPTTPLELKFGFTLPTLMDVPGRTAIHIHPGNIPENTEGCLLPGFKSDVDTIYDSRNAFFKLKDEILKRLGFGKVYIQIFGGS